MAAHPHQTPDDSGPLPSTPVTVWSLCQRAAVVAVLFVLCFFSFFSWFCFFFFLDSAFGFPLFRFFAENETNADQDFKNK
jgi:hypothetical protein